MSVVKLSSNLRLIKRTPQDKTPKNMKLKTTGNSHSVFSTRRDFLKTTAAASAALAGGLAPVGACASNGSGSADPVDRCSFSQLPENLIYLNSGTEGSMPDCVLSTFQYGLRKWAASPTTSYEIDPELGKRQELNRSKVAQFLGVGKNNICLADNTTMGCSMTLMGLNFGPGDTVVTTNHEHNAIRSPLLALEQRRGLRIETRPFPSVEPLSRMGAADLVDFLFPNIPALRGARALCASHVYPTTGVRLPLRLLREKADELKIPYLIVDGAQAMGMIHLGSNDDSLVNCDFYACPGHKWLNGPPGTGVLYIKNADISPPEFYPTLSQRMGKYSGSADDSTSGFPMAEALQVRGCSNAAGFAAMITAMNFAREEGGAAHIEKRILKRSREVKDMILSQAPNSLISPHTDPALSSGLTVFFPFSWGSPQTLFRDQGTAERVVMELMERNIQIRYIAIPNVDSPGQSSENLYALRVSTAYFNTAVQIETFGIALKEVLTHIN